MVTAQPHKAQRERERDRYRDLKFKAQSETDDIPVENVGGRYRMG